MCNITENIYDTLFVKRNAHLIPNFLWPSGEGGPKIHIVGYVKGTSKIEHVNFWPPPPGGYKKFGIKCAFLFTQTNNPPYSISVVYY